MRCEKSRLERAVMKDPHDLLQKKVLDVKRVRREIAALHDVISLLAEASDCAEFGLAIPPNVQEARAKTKSPAGMPVLAELSSGLSFLTNRTLLRFWQIKQGLSRITVKRAA
jgi:hypothetical protein